MKLETYLWMFEMIKSVCVGQEEEINDRSSAESGRVLDMQWGASSAKDDWNSFGPSFPSINMHSAEMKKKYVDLLTRGLNTWENLMPKDMASEYLNNLSIWSVYLGNKWVIEY